MVTLSAQEVRHERRRRRHAIQHVVYSVDRHSGAICRGWGWPNHMEFDMKSEEDEAFDDLAKRQGDWGGGYQAKRKMAADKLQEPVVQPAQEPDWKTMPPKDAPLVQWAKEQTAPPQRPWVGLTAEDFSAIKFPAEMRFPAEFRAGARWAEVKLKEKNT